MNYSAALQLTIPRDHDTPAGSELDAMVSAVMGDRAPYSTDLLHAWRLLTILKTEGLSFGVYSGTELWSVSMGRHRDGKLSWHAEGYHYSSPAVAICLAFLNAAKAIAEERTPALQEAA